MKAALSIAFENLRGKAGNVVIQGGRSGLVLRPRVTSRNPSTAAQQSIRSAMSKAAATYSTLNSSQLAAWENYANTQVKVNPVSGAVYHPSANAAFVGLATKFLQATPGGSIPTTPPSSAFAGDSVVVTVSASEGAITFTASRSNALGVTTELLLQPLASPARKPKFRDYRTQAFQVFALAPLTRTITVPAGYYAAAYRFVDVATGQASPLVPVAIIQHVTAVLEEEKRAA